MREGFRRLLRGYTRILNKYTYGTQIVSGGVMWCAGDILCQAIVHHVREEEQPLRLHAPPAPDEPAAISVHRTTDRGGAAFAVDWARTGRMVAYGMCISAPLYAFWYSYLDRYSHRLFARSPPGVAPRLPPRLRALLGRLALPSWAGRGGAPAGGEGSARMRIWKIISFKLAMDTLVFDPVYLVMFFTLTSMMEGLTPRGIAEKLRQNFAEAWLMDVSIWTPIQTANFRFVPVLYQPLVVQSCNIGWNAYLSFVQHRQMQAPRPAEPLPATP